MIPEWHGPAGADRYTPWRDAAIDRIVIHTMIDSIEGADRTFKAGSRVVSAHFGVAMDGRVWQWVATDNIAWHAGSWPMNQRSIGIEHEDKGNYNGIRPDELYTASAQLIHQICRLYGISIDRQHIIKHSEVIPTGCPDALNIDRLVQEAGDMALQEEFTTFKTDTENTIKAMKEAYDKLYHHIHVPVPGQVDSSEPFFPPVHGATFAGDDSADPHGDVFWLYPGETTPRIG